MENNIKNLRKEKGLTQQQLSKALNLDQTSVSKWENEKSIPDTQTLIRLAEFFDVSTDYILGRSSFFYPDRLSVKAHTPDEQRLLDLFRKLNRENRVRLTAYAEIRLEEQGDLLARK